MRWQKKARLGVAIFGIAFAIVVYAAIGDRLAVAPLERPSRLDPRAMVESVGAAIEQFREATRDYAVECGRQLTYEDGSTTCIDVTIRVSGKAGRDFVVTGGEARARDSQRAFEVTKGVKMTASDGLVVSAESATFDQGDATLRVPGAVTFQKAGMSGSGVGMTYDEANDLLVLQQEAHVTVVNEAGEVLTDFTSGSATLSRLENYLSLAGAVHVMRGEQVIEADNGLARLSENEEFITYIELRGNSRVVGGTAFDSMSARDVDLDYTDDGAVLERAILNGNGAIALKGSEGATGRQFLGESLEFAFAPDASITRVVGRNNVQLDLPAAAGAPARRIKARAIDAGGEAGKGLTRARFTNDVEFTEAAARGGVARTVRSRELNVALAGEEVTAATFTGAARVDEQGLAASAARIEYDPGRGTLSLAGTDTGGGPHVEDAQITVDATTIDLTIEGRAMTARGTVRTTLRPRQDPKNRLPGLLEQGQAATVSADAMEYQGASGRVVYTGSADLVQGATSVRAQTITIDQATGDLVATGGARSTMSLDSGTSHGTANEIRYQDARRVIVYDTPVAPPTPPVIATPPPAAGAVPAPGAVAAPGAVTTPVVPPAAATSRLNGGPQGDLQAARIEVFLAEAGSAVERLAAETGVSVRMDTRRAAAAKMIYYAADGRYDMTGLPTAPVTVFENSTCRETTGRTVTFFKDSDRIIVDGNEQTRTRSSRGSGPCVPTPAR